MRTNRTSTGMGIYVVIAVAIPLLLSAAPVAAQEAPGKTRPNIVLLIADDLGWTDLSTGRTTGGHGSKFHQTPNIDRLASEGLSFTSAYANQNCQPSRASLMTGQYAPRNGVYNVGSLSRGAANPPLTPPAQSTSLRAEAVTFAETLKAAGYVTAHVGKFHVSATPEAIRTQHGFDFNYGGGAKGDGGPAGYFAVPAGTESDRSGAVGPWHFTTMGPELSPFAAPYTAAYIERNLRPWARGNDPSSLVGTPKHLTDAQGDAALAFLDQHRSGSDQAKPFLLNVAFNAVHAAIRPRPDVAAKYAKLPATDPRHTNGGYAALLDQMDQTVGRILARLDDPNSDGDRSDSIAGNTLVLFVSDNGGFGGATVNTPLRGAKGMFSEGGIRVPFIARWPGSIPPGTASGGAIHLIDLYPTLAEVAGAPLPDAKAHPLDGVSLTGVLRGKEKAPVGRDALYWHFPGYLDTRAIPCSVIVKDRKEEKRRFKLLYFYEDQHYELYDLTGDPGEDSNLLGKQVPTGALRIIAEDLRADLVAWLDRQQPAYPTVAATGKKVSRPVSLDEARYDVPRFEGRLKKAARAPANLVPPKGRTGK